MLLWSSRYCSPVAFVRSVPVYSLWEMQDMGKITDPFLPSWCPCFVVINGEKLKTTIMSYLPFSILLPVVKKEHLLIPISKNEHKSVFFLVLSYLRTFIFFPSQFGRPGLIESVHNGWVVFCFCRGWMWRQATILCVVCGTTYVSDC